MPSSAASPPSGSSIALHQPTPLQLSADSHTQPDGVTIDDSLHLRDILRIVLKHKWMLVASLVVCVLIATLATFFTTPRYRATATLQIDTTAARIVNFNRELDGSDLQAYEGRSYTATQIELLRGRALAERVVDDMRLDQPEAAARSARAAGSGDARARPGASEPQGSGGGLFRGVWGEISSGYRKAFQPAVNDTGTLGKEATINAFRASLKIEPLANSKLVRMHVENTDAELAARIANTAAQTFINMNLERRFEASSYAKTFLEQQIKQTKAKLEESERKLNEFSKAKQILTLDEKTSVVNQTFTEYSAALSKAEQDRIKAEAIYEEVRKSPSTASQIIDNKVVQTLREQRAKVETEYLDNLKIYKPAFPKMQQLQTQITELDRRIKEETVALEASVKAQYDSAKRQEDLIRARLSDTRRLVMDTQTSSIDLNLLKREVDTNRQLFDGLLQRFKEVGVAGGVGTNNISLVDKALVPLFPYKPRLVDNILIGLMVGLFVGLSLIFLLEYLDDSIKYPDEIERLLGVALLGVIPVVKKRADAPLALLAHEDPRSAFAEAYRSVRTALQFSTAEGAPRRLAITSCGKNEGKSTTSLSLAINFAQMQRPVLLIDGDMRNPTVHRQLDMGNDAGLSNFLSGDNQLDNLICKTAYPYLAVMTAGPTPPNPVDLLTGSRLLELLDKAEEAGYAYIIVDGPPVLGIADAIVIGNQIRNSLFVVEAGKTRKSHIKDALRRLRMAGIVPRGVVLSKASSQDSLYGYESYYGYYGAPGADAPTNEPRLTKAA